MSANPDHRDQEGEGGRASMPPDLPASAPVETNQTALDVRRESPIERLGEERVGAKIGRYLLVEKLGEGGFGSVYVAEQHEPVKRRVALKIIKLGMDTQQVVARFDAERQLLALMDHPSIARVFDAGATASGRPYLVMELVPGVPITRYCDEQSLTIEQRLRLFVAVCQAIQHAHQKGVIHRDIKPSNILVATIDGAPLPKVIDFGIAKATQGDLSGQQVLTQFQQFVGTPAYMSPEQAAMDGTDIDTRSDVYGLGVLLYELLVGGTPFAFETRSGGGLETMRKVILETEPPGPSTRLRGMNAADRALVAALRGCGAGVLLQRLQGDLDCIVMKSLEKDRSRRYETASALAADLKRYLANEPVVARAPSGWYVFQKLVRRHRLAFGAVAMMVMTLVAAFGVSLAILMRLWAARELAQTEAVKSIEVGRFFKEMLQGIGPSVAFGRDTTLLRELLDRMATRVGAGLTNQPDVEAELRFTLGVAYGQLGDRAAADRMLEESLRLRMREFGTNDVRFGRMLNQLAVIHRERGDLQRARQLYEQSLGLARRELGPRHHTVAAVLHNLSQVLMDLGDLERAEQLQREALSTLRQASGDFGAEIAASLGNLARIQERRGDGAGAEASSRDALELRRKVSGTNAVGHPDIALAINNLATFLARRGDLEEAERLSREALAMQRRVLGQNHPDLALALGNLGGILADRGDVAAAEQAYLEALPIARRKPGDEHPHLVVLLHNYSMLLGGLGRFREAAELERERLKLLDRWGHPDHTERLSTLANLGWLLSEWAREEVGSGRATVESVANALDSERLLEECLERRTRVLGPTDWLLANTCGLLAGSRIAVAATDGSLTSAARVARLKAAEDDLKSLYEDLSRAHDIPPALRERWIHQAADRLVWLYETWTALQPSARVDAQQDEWRETRDRLSGGG